MHAEILAARLELQIARLDLLIEAAQARVDALDAVDKQREEIEASNEETLDAAKKSLTKATEEARQSNEAERSEEAKSAKEFAASFGKAKIALIQAVNDLKTSRDEAFEALQDIKEQEIKDLEKGTITIESNREDTIDILAKIEKQKELRQEQLAKQAQIDRMNQRYVASMNVHDKELLGDVHTVMHVAHGLMDTHANRLRGRWQCKDHDRQSLSGR